MLGFNRPAFLLVTGTIAAATVLAVNTLAVMGPVTGDQWFLFGLFSVFAGLSYFHPIRLEGDEPVSYILSSAFLIAGAFRLPPGLLSLMCLLLVIPGFMRNRRKDRILKDAFNASNYLLSAQSAALVIRVIGLHGHFDGASLVAVLFAIALDIGLSTALVASVLSLNLGVSFRKSPVWDVRFLAADAMISAMGALAGLVSFISAWAVFLAVIPLLLPYWMLRNMHLVRMVDVDPKTGLYNHRYFQKRLPELLGRSRYIDRPIALLFADLDFLRDVNNTYGHLAGDQVLKQVAEVLLHHTRPGDLLARWGGEEFVVVLPNADQDLAFGVAERLCDAIRNHPFEIGQAEPLRCTISIGVATAPLLGWNPEHLLHEADLAMYRAKAGGRDQACLAPLQSA